MTTIQGQPSTRMAMLAAITLFALGVLVWILGFSGISASFPLSPYRFSAYHICWLGGGMSLAAILFSLRPTRLAVGVTLSAGILVGTFAAFYRPADRGDMELIFFPGDGTNRWLGTRLCIGGADWCDVYSEYHPVFGIRGRAFAVARHHTRDFDVVYNLGEDGFRVMPTPSRDGALEIAFVGCSYTFGVGVPDQSTFPYLLARYAWPDFRVRNCSMSGWGANNVCLMIEELLQSDRKPLAIIYPLIDHHYRRVALRDSWHRTVGMHRFPSFTATGDYLGLLDPAGRTKPDGTEVEAEETAIMKALIRRMHDACRKANVSFMVVVLQNNENRNLNDILDIPGLAVLDAQEACDRVYPHDSHPKPQAHWQIARLIATSPALSELTRRPPLKVPDAFPDVFPHENDFFLRIQGASSANDATILQSGSPPTGCRVEEIQSVSPQMNNVRIVRRSPGVREGKRVAVSFEARCEREGKAMVSLIKRHDGGDNLWRGSHFWLEGAWRSYEFQYRPSETDPFSLVEFHLGSLAGPFEIRSLEVKELDEKGLVGWSLWGRDDQAVEASLRPVSKDRWRVADIKLPSLSAESLALESGDFPLLRGENRSLIFSVRSDSRRSVVVKVVSSNEKPIPIGLRREVTLAETEVSYRLPFQVESNDLSARVRMEFGQSDIPFEVSGVRLIRTSQPDEAETSEP